MNPTSLTIRVYGLLIAENRILLSRENIKGDIHIKFPGGGLELGEGVVDCLKREFWEEVGIGLSSIQHFYTTEDFFASAFHSSTQVISIYYTVKSNSINTISTRDPSQTELLKKDGDQILYWCDINELNSQDIQLPIDKIIVQKVIDQYIKSKNP